MIEAVTGGKPPAPRTQRKQADVIKAAVQLFLAQGYLGTNMDEIAAVSGVTKQTIYQYFGSKEALFTQAVSRTANGASDEVHDEIPARAPGEDVRTFLERYAVRQLNVVLQPRVMQLRRLVIGEAHRFPKLARALFDGGPQRALAALATVFGGLHAQGLLNAPDASLAAEHFNWLVMGGALNRAMLLGDGAIPDQARQHLIARQGVTAFLAAYGPTEATSP